MHSFFKHLSVIIQLFFILIGKFFVLYECREHKKDKKRGVGGGKEDMAWSLVNFKYPFSAVRLILFIDCVCSLLFFSLSEHKYKLKY